MKGNRFVIIGLGQIGQALLKRLSRESDITVVALDAEAEETLKKMKREEVRLIKGDATSRLVLKEALAEEADAVIITTTAEDVNIEIASVLREHFKPPKVISVGFTQKAAESLEALGAGVEPILGSFMAGVIFSYVFRSKGRFEDKINAVGYGFFTPFFFIGVGAGFDVSLLGSPGAVMFALFLSLMVLLSNVFPVVFALFAGRGFLEAAGTALLLSSPLAMMIVAGTLGGRMGLLEERTLNSVILAAIISGLIYPSIFRALGKRILRKAEEAGPSPPEP